jgi:hypothetical protein
MLDLNIVHYLLSANQIYSSPWSIFFTILRECPPLPKHISGVKEAMQYQLSTCLTVGIVIVQPCSTSV